MTTSPDYYFRSFFSLLILLYCNTTNLSFDIQFDQITKQFVLHRASTAEFESQNNVESEIYCVCGRGRGRGSLQNLLFSDISLRIPTP
jgi:hypothetical protein